MAIGEDRGFDDHLLARRPLDRPPAIVDLGTHALDGDA
jgi:hypothetical protein